ncbi:aminopeptidase N [Candidatus Phycosocius spiralis]|nr:aminopeptidase N [Candidatus Phycosocius spiralis]
MRTISQIAVQLMDYCPFPFTITHVSLVFDLNQEHTVVTTMMTVERRVYDGAKEAPFQLDGVGLELLELSLNGQKLDPNDYHLDEVGLIIPMVPDAFKLETKVAINPAANTALSGLYISAGRFCTQCEAEGFRHITFWPDRPDVMSRFHVRIEAPQDQFPTLLSNGNCVAIGQYGDGRHWASWDDPYPKPSYLFALVAGSFDTWTDHFTTRSGREVSLCIYVDHGVSPRASYAMDALKRAMAWDEKTFDREYDLDVFNIVAVADFNFGAMENKGLNIFNSALVLADETTATDTDYEAIEAVVAHEYFHNWSGNRVTCRDWFQLSLKEGLTVFRDQEFSADQRSRAVKRIQDSKALRGRQFSEDSGPLAHPVRPSSYVKIENFYTTTIYEKGAEIVRIIQTLIGEQAFKDGLNLYFDDYDGTAATIEDWLHAMRMASDNPLTGIERWYDQAGTPLLTVSSSFDEGTQRLRLFFRQATPDTPGQTTKSWVPIPIKLAFFDHNGAMLRLTLAGTEAAADEWLIPMASDRLVIEFEGASRQPVASYLRGFSAPVRLRADQTSADLALLAACDTDPFVRWESAQTIFRSSLLLVSRALAKGEEPEIPDDLHRVFQGSLGEAGRDPAFAALLLRLPEVPDLMQLQANCNPSNLVAARVYVRSVIAQQLDGPLSACFATYDPAQEFSTGAAAAGRRALMAACLDLLSATGTDRAALRAANLFAAARNMTDTMAALSALSQFGGPRYDAALNAFRNHYQDNALVMDKWFRVQAMALCGDPLTTYATLRSDPLFTLTNPNRVRALGGAFAQGNPAAFHRDDGEGYALMGTLISDVDRLNSALAARLATFFDSCVRVDEARRLAAFRTIEGLLANNSLSANTREILTKIISGLTA